MVEHVEQEAGGLMQVAHHAAGPHGKGALPIGARGDAYDCAGERGGDAAVDVAAQHPRHLPVTAEHLVQG